MNCAVLGTNRGEADGFALDILSKLKDVKSKVSVSLQRDHHLLCYIEYCYWGDD